MQVYQDVTDPRQSFQFEKVSTPKEIADEQMKQNANFHYYRIPVADEKMGLVESVSKNMCFLFVFLLINLIFSSNK